MKKLLPLIALLTISLAARTQDSSSTKYRDALIIADILYVADSTEIAIKTARIAELVREQEVLFNALLAAERSNTLSDNIRAVKEAEIIDLGTDITRLSAEVRDLERGMKKLGRKVWFWKTVAVVGPIVTLVIVKLI